eukprot:scaffold1508_cov178-Amphora_coffeaeformis.AAC.24
MSCRVGGLSPARLLTKVEPNSAFHGGKIIRNRTLPSLRSGASLRRSPAAFSSPRVVHPDHLYRRDTVRCWTSSRGGSSSRDDDKNEFRHVTEAESTHTTTLATTVMTRSPPHDDEDHIHDPIEAAKHQVEHRAKEKTGVEISRLLAERALEAGERFERSAIKSAEHMTERAIKEGAERVGERISQQSLSKAGERIGERAIKEGAERAGERIAEKSLSKAGERIGERSMKEGAERIGERVALSGERILEKTREHIGERAAKEGAERVGEHLALSGKRMLGKTGERVGEHAALSGERVFGIQSERALERLYERTLTKTIRRLGRGLLVVLPALGGVFAVWLYRMDHRRAVVEKSFEAKYLFHGAALGDAIDAVCHFVIAYAVFEGWEHSFVMQFEKCSIACAVLSTVFAVSGEIISYRRVKREQSKGVATKKGGV